MCQTIIMGSHWTVFVQPALTAIQNENLTVIAATLLLGSGFNLSAISRMWLKETCVNCRIFSDTEIDTEEVQIRCVTHALTVYHVVAGYFITDDTVNHHTWLCTLIHRVCVLFDYAFQGNSKAVCVVVLYYSDGVLMKCSIRLSKNSSDSN